MISLAIDDNLLVAYVDGELDPKLTQQVKAQIDNDPVLTERVAMFRRGDALLKAAMPESLFSDTPSGLVKAVDRMVARTPAWNWPWASPMAAAIAGFMLGAASLLGYFGGSAAKEKASISHVLHEVAEYHAVFSREQEHLVEVGADRKDHIKSWLGDRVKIDLKVPDLAERGLEFRGARLLAVNGGPIAQLMYINAANEPVALCVGLDKTQNDPARTGLITSSEGGFSLLGWAQDGHVFVVVGPADQQSLTRSLADEMPDLMRRSRRRSEPSLPPLEMKT